jgi:CubicO group peptidase (beta-lactamase class C family)
MSHRKFAPLSILVLAAGSMAAHATAADVVAQALQPYIDNRTLAGAVTLVATPDKVLSVGTIGYADIAARRPIEDNSLFWIASMSKAFTTAAMMMLVDEGKVNVNDPVEKYLPEFKDQWLAVETDKDHILLKRPPRPITIHDIMSHTSGLHPTSAMETPTLDLFPLIAGVRTYAMTPLDFAPGARYQYANAGINTAGRIVEVVSGMPYAEFLETRLLDPLGLKDTTFWPTPEQIRRLAKSYKSNLTTKELEETPIGQLRYPLDDHTRQPMPAGGLFSTARDTARFCQMILNGGVLDGKRYLSAEAIHQMTSIQTGDLPQAYGFGWRVNRKATGDGLSAGSFGHGGAYKTAMWIDPQRKLVMVLMRQHSGPFLVPEGNKIEAVFLKAAIERFGNAQ